MRSNRVGNSRVKLIGIRLCQNSRQITLWLKPHIFYLVGIKTARKILNWNVEKQFENNFADDLPSFSNRKICSGSLSSTIKYNDPNRMSKRHRKRPMIVTSSLASNVTYLTWIRSNVRYAFILYGYKPEATISKSIGDRYFHRPGYWNGRIAYEGNEPHLSSFIFSVTMMSPVNYFLGVEATCFL